jgi:hypothetical protein
MDPGQKLTRKQEQAVAALLVQPTVAQAAKKIGLNERTLRRWLKEPTFARTYAEARRGFLEHSIGRLQRATTAAVTTLARAAREDVRAAVAVIDRAVKGAEMLDVLARLEALEAAAKERKAIR